MQTVNDIIQEYRTALSDSYESGELEQIIFLAFEHVCGFSKMELVMNRTEALSDDKASELRNILERLKKQEPIQYIIGSTEFYGLQIQVNHHVLIPRQETEELVDLIIKDGQLHPLRGGGAILDICTGSGCIAIALKKNISHSTVSALDISGDAIKIAEKNSELNNAAVSFVTADILKTESLAALFTDRFDVMVSNPPYVMKSEMSDMTEKVLNHEPHLALFVENNDALIFYKQIAELATHSLNNGGRLYFEINEHKGKEICEMLAEKGFQDIKLKQDLNGKDRMVCCRLM